MRMSNHVILRKSVDLEIRIILHHGAETVVILLWCSFDLLNPGREGLIQFLVNLCLKFSLVINGISFGFQLVIKPQMHQIPMHVLFEHFCVNQIFTAQLVNLLLADKLILIINDFFLLFFELFGDIFNVRNPFRGGSELGNEETANFGVLQCGQDHTAVWHNCAHIDSVLGLNTCNEVAIAVCDFDLLLVAENYVFFVIVQEVNRIDRLVVRRFQTEQLSVKSDIEN